MKSKLIFSLLTAWTLLACYPAASQSGDAAESFQVYSKFDFIPGEKTIFYDDFSDGTIGDFPANWNTNGSGEIVNTNLAPGKWFQFKGEGYYIAESTGVFPENFTVEFDLIPVNKDNNEGEAEGTGVYIVSGNMKDPNEGGAIPGKAGIKLNIGNNGLTNFSSYADGEYKADGTREISIKPSKKYRISIWVQKQRVRLYVDENKVFDLPRALPEGHKYNIIRFENGEYSNCMIGGFRIAAGLPDIRSKLLTEGKLVSYGVYFDVNSDKVKPQSNGTLKEVAQVLKDNPTVKIKIVGHTDGDGDEAANLDLSKRRAESVKTELSKDFGIDASRITSEGKGESQPIAANDTPANKAKNRRVEFIKL